MTQARIDRAVAAATGEDISTIKRMGFSIANLDHPEFDPDPALPRVVDWDALNEERVVIFPVCQRRIAA